MCLKSILKLMALCALNNIEATPYLDHMGSGIFQSKVTTTRDTLQQYNTPLSFIHVTLVLL